MPKKSLPTSKSLASKKARARALVRVLKRLYPTPKSELTYTTPFQFVVAVMLSAQCTDKAVNKVTASLFTKYKTAKDFATLRPTVLQKQISAIPFFRNKAKAIIGAAKVVAAEHGGVVPREEAALVALPGVGYKTAHVILAELYDLYEGIPTDTHVKRFAKRFELSSHDDLKKISKDLESLIPKKDWKYVNNGFVLYGRYTCPARPHECVKHPLTKLYPNAARIWPKTT